MRSNKNFKWPHARHCIWTKIIKRERRGQRDRIVDRYNPCFACSQTGLSPRIPYRSSSTARFPECKLGRIPQNLGVLLTKERGGKMHVLRYLFKLYTNRYLGDSKIKNIHKRNFKSNQCLLFISKLWLKFFLKAAYYFRLISQASENTIEHY